MFNAIAEKYFINNDLKLFTDTPIDWYELEKPGTIELWLSDS